MIAFFPSSQATRVRCDEWYARVALATNARVRPVHARKLLGWAPYGPDLTPGQFRMPARQSTRKSLQDA